VVRIAFALALVGLLAWPGCSYRLAGRRGSGEVPVALPTWTNDSLEPGAELVLAAALRRELERSGRFRVVERRRADGFAVQGRIAAIETFGRTFTPGIRAIEYTMVVQLDLAVSGPGGRRVAVDPFAQRATDIYLASTDIEISRKNRDEALRRLAGMLAGRIRRELERAVEAAEPAAGARRPPARAAATGGMA
jgi:hypothetical protein